MASPRPASPSFYPSMVIGAPATDDDEDMFICTRRNKHPNQKVLRVPKTCSTGSEEQHTAEEDGEQDERSKRSHECVLQMNTSWAVPPRRTSDFILDSRATSHVVADMSLFSPPSFRTTKNSRSKARRGSAAADAAYYQAHDGKVLTVAGVGTVSSGRFHIPNVRCVPDLCTGLNLISVQQLAECNYLVMFGGGQCSVMEQSSGEIVGRGLLHADDGLYHLQFLDLSRGDKACEQDSTA